MESTSNSGCPDDDALRQAVRAASQRFAQQHVVAVISREIMPDFDEYAARHGFRFELVDDGEDDGIPKFVLRPCSRRAGEQVKLRVIQRRAAVYLFGVWSVMTVVEAAAHQYAYMGVSAVLMGAAAWAVVWTDRRVRWGRDVMQRMIARGE